jgi:DNA repair exonuclease SbcCD ATPase subunit
MDTVAELEDQFSKSSDIVAKLQLDNHQLEERIVEENRLAASLTDQRHQMLVQLEIIQRQMRQIQDERQQQLTMLAGKEQELVRKQMEQSSKKKALQSRLKELEREINAVADHSPKSEVIHHFPNPIAKTVFSEEVHFQLSNGKLAYVPMDELILRMKSEWKVKAEKLKQASRTVETVGPIKNFRMQYELVTETFREQTPNGLVEGQAIRFNQFFLLPRAGELGESVDTALAQQSEFREILSRHEPSKTTVSIWVYPDSFPEHNQVKNWLHENGYQMASWPLEEGRKISGGPNGFKTSAQ